VILLLDESDALLGQRTDVQNANDRYANLETNFLLQGFESYEGILLVTTNARTGCIDTAFDRRMDVTVKFYAPDAGSRLRSGQRRALRRYADRELLHW
jgi:SpoVK/Ycf46/Vps4 family AAA+-type ATPase